MTLREQMMTNVIQKFGFEAEQTIRFAEYLEQFSSERVILIAYNNIMAEPIERD